MLKKVFLATAATLILASATVPVQPSPAQAKIFSGCRKAAKAAYPHDRKARKHYRKVCRAHWKAAKHAK
jgi:hypothetical protein